MIGQHNLITQLDNYSESETQIRFIILVGPKGSGKKTLAREFSKKLSAIEPYIVSIQVDEIRKMIKASYEITEPIVYMIADADNMSIQAKNALLKVTEEPPNKAFFILTLTDENNTLPTILSRGAVYKMNRYTPSEIWQYFDAESYKIGEQSQEIDIIKNICETPGEVELIKQMGILDFYNYVELVVDNIASTSTSNSFKIADKVALKSDSNGYDLALFLKSFILICTNRTKFEEISNDIKYMYLKSAQITAKYLQDLHIKSINKQMLFDNWIIDIRKVWL